MNKWDKVLEEFIGKNKVISLKITENKKKAWDYFYKEKIDGKWQNKKIELPTREEAEKFHMKFGGKNPSTVAAPYKFIKLSDWNSDDIEKLGHKVSQITLHGFRQTRNKKVPIYLPDNCGHDYLIGKQRKQTNKNKLNLSLKDREECDVTRCFKTKEEFDNFIEFLKSEPCLKELTWHIIKIHLENEDTKDVGHWSRCRAKDGTDRMILELKKINKKPYTEMLYMDILTYADGMADAECQKIPKKSKLHEQTVCYFAAKSGKIKGE